jgi:hypothetical protein
LADADDFRAGHTAEAIEAEQGAHIPRPVSSFLIDLGVDKSHLV